MTEFDDQPAPTFQMSEAGKALRAEMEAASKASTPSRSPFPTRAEADAAKASDPSPTVVDPDSGDTINLLDGMKESGPAPSSEITPELAILPPDVHEEARAYALDMEAIVQGEGIQPERGQAIFDAISDLHMAQDHALAITTPEAATGVLTSRYGAEESQRIVADARDMARRSPALWHYLETTGTGSSPAVLLVLALAQRGQLRVSSSEAAAKVKTLTGDTTKLGIDTRRILARLAQPQRGRQDRAGYFPRDAGNPTSTLAPMTTGKSIRDRIAELNADPDLLSADGPKRKKLVDERARLMAQLGGT
jgi:hypothetical protein